VRSGGDRRADVDDGLPRDLGTQGEDHLLFGRDPRSALPRSVHLLVPSRVPAPAAVVPRLDRGRAREVRRPGSGAPLPGISNGDDPPSLRPPPPAGLLRGRPRCGGRPPPPLSPLPPG